LVKHLERELDADVRSRCARDEEGSPVTSLANGVVIQIPGAICLYRLKVTEKERIIFPSARGLCGERRGGRSGLLLYRKNLAWHVHPPAPRRGHQQQPHLMGGGRT